MTHNLGLLPPTPAKPRLRLASVLKAAAVPPFPAAFDFIGKVPSWPLYDNDQIGDCGPAGSAHLLTALTTYGSGDDVVLDEAEVVAFYSLVSGYNPATGANDDGVNLQDMLSRWRKDGLGGHKILAFAEVDLSNDAEVDYAIHTFGGILIGANMPKDAESQFDYGLPFTPTTGAGGRAGSWGGHCMHVGAYDPVKRTLTTWGAVTTASLPWWRKYVGEAWVVITPEWADHYTGKTPSGLGLYDLGQQFSAMTGEPNPFPSAPGGSTPAQGAPFPFPEWTPALVARATALAGKAHKTLGQYTNDRLTTLLK